MIVQTPLGGMELISDGTALVRACFVEQTNREASGTDEIEQLAARQLGEYLDGQRTEFTVQLKPSGTPFQRMVWEQLEHIPYGQTISYGEVAAAIGKPQAARAVGMACGRNPIWIFLPCHRVVGRNGELTGYAGGLMRKRWLLDWERQKR